MNNTVYIHYGSDHFDRRRFHKIRNEKINIAVPSKPEAKSGLWASLIEDPNGWIKWCEANKFCLDGLTSFFKFKLLPTARVLYITDPWQLKEAKKNYQWHEYFEIVEDHNKYRVTEREHMRFCPDFSKLANDYDAMFVKIWWDEFDGTYWQLYGWDVDSLLVFNPNVVEEIKDDAVCDRQ